MSVAPTQGGLIYHNNNNNNNRLTRPTLTLSPSTVLDQHEHCLHQQTIKEVLVQWKDTQPEDSTWESTTILQQFPDLNP
jgi:hypothetical protein